MSQLTDDISLNIQIEDSDITVRPNGVSVLMKESVHEVLPTVGLSFSDPDGLFREQLTFIENNAMKVSFLRSSNEEKALINAVITEDELTEPLVPGVFGGVVTVKGIHNMFLLNGKEGRTYEGTIRNAVQAITDNLGFEKTIIEETTGVHRILRPGISKVSFIQNILLPQAFGPSSESSPFFCWIDLQNNFHFESYNKLIKTPTEITLEYKVQPSIPGTTASNNTILAYKNISTGSRVNQPYRNMYMFTRNRTTGEFTRSTLRESDFPQGLSGKTLLNKNGVYDSISSLAFNYWDDTDRPNRGLMEGRKANYFRNNLAGQRFSVTTPANFRLKAGGTVQINLRTVTDGQNNGFSYLHSGVYFIEEVTHYWNGKDRQFLTSIVISRKFFSVPLDYPQEGKL